PPLGLPRRRAEPARRHRAAAGRARLGDARRPQPRAARRRPGRAAGRGRASAQAAQGRRADPPGARRARLRAGEVRAGELTTRAATDRPIDAGMARPTIATTATGPGAHDERWLTRIERLVPGRRGPVAGDFRLAQRNIYILPSRAGAAFI